MRRARLAIVFGTSVRTYIPYSIVYILTDSITCIIQRDCISIPLRCGALRRAALCCVQVLCLFISVAVAEPQPQLTTSAVPTAIL